MTAPRPPPGYLPRMTPFTAAAAVLAFLIGLALVVGSWRVADDAAAESMIGLGILCLVLSLLLAVGVPG